MLGCCFPAFTSYVLVVRREAAHLWLACAMAWCLVAGGCHLSSEIEKNTRIGTFYNRVHVTSRQTEFSGATKNVTHHDYDW